MHIINLTALLTLALAGLPVLAKFKETLGNINFPDPSLTFDPHSSAWHAFATNSNGTNVQAAVSGARPNDPWTLLAGVDLLPHPGPWVDTHHPDIWAPDVQYLPATDSFVLYYSGLQAGSPHHCLGTARSPNITGPYVADKDPLYCELSRGGGIDGSGFFDAKNNTRWVVFKVDGSSKGPGGPCGNGDPPGFPTPILLQRVDVADGVTKIGEPVRIIDRIPELDGPLVEAPNLIKVGGLYVLFYSSHCYNQPEYDVKYATAVEITGPYIRQSQILGGSIATDGPGGKEHEAPGGASSIPGGGTMVFHANCDAGRCMYETDFRVEDGMVKLSAEDEDGGFCGR